MKHRILCCTRPGTGSRDGHTCVTSYTYHFWNICGNLKIALGGNPFVFNGEPRLNVPSLLERSLNMHFSPKIRHILPPCDNCDIKNRGKRVKKFWSNLADSENATFLLCILTVAIFACVSGQRTSCLSRSPFFFFHCSPMKIRPGQAEKNEKVSSVYRLRQSTITEMMKRCVPYSSETECGREASGDEVEVCTFPVTHVYTWK